MTTISEHIIIGRMQAEQYEVEAVLAEKTVPEGNSIVTRFLIKWKGYPKEEATWEPLHNLDNCMDMINKFRQEQSRKNAPKAPSQPKERPKLPSQPKPKSNPSQRKNPVRQPAYQAINRNDFYFEDESDFPASQEKPKPASPSPLPQRPRRQGSLEAKPKPTQKKPGTSAEPREEAKRRSRKKKDWKEQLQEERQGPAVELLHRREEEQLKMKPAKLYKSIRRHSVVTASVKVQTDPFQTNAGELEVISMHTSPDFPGKVWFTLKKGDKFIEMPREKVLEANPMAIYSFYHKHYQVAKAKTAQKQAILLQDARREIERPRSRHGSNSSGRKSGRSSGKSQVKEIDITYQKVHYDQQECRERVIKLMRKHPNAFLPHFRNK